VPHPPLRLRLYRRMAGLATMDEIEDMEGELQDRFGSLPEATVNLLYQLRLKVLALRAGVQAISAQERQVSIRVNPLRPLRDTAYKQLQRRLSGRARVSQRQVWLLLHEREEVWRRELVEVLEAMGEIAQVRL
jgi:transcription-repair coupling factor (superfamily II helicase)